MVIDWTAVLVSIISGVFSYLVGHHRGRKVHRSGDYMKHTIEEDAE